MYEIRISPEKSKTITSRTDAITAAKKLSENRRSPVKLLRKDGWERMLFAEGSLIEGTIVTHDRRTSTRRLR